ncbi:uncharacterized protein LOC111357820 [Spodoptera litura]|uniref:Uncharacterized protein LOC111355018 n=1 Tax=Spodoptera litura TaxID=69820 RepID=A0A9J7EEY0_SPOLT|nr:uncharacterized protein LOC111355018 [Spodoptera litura]XP_022826757.1 uncharacterized protein LOC111356582 [Spodoptera litura]XP_022828397.1 uncharacterized protein LOC111357820 [Spodoptera litura]
MASIGECSGCRNVLGDEPYLGCFSCRAKYDLVCANMTSNDYKQMNANQKASWKCPECCCKEPKIGNVNTPVRSTQCSITKSQEEDVQGQSNVTVRKRPTKSPLKSSQRPLHKQVQKLPPKLSQKAAAQSSQKSPPKLQLQSTLGPPQPQPQLLEPSSPVTENKLREIVQQETCTTLNLKIKKIVAAELKSVIDTMNSFRNSLEFVNKKYEEMKSKYENAIATVTELRHDNESLKTTIRDLTTRVNVAELHMRDSNIEINGIPESRSENLVTTVIQLSKVIENPLTKEDINHAVRVAKISNDNPRPRPVIVKLRNPRSRDDILAAVSKFNRKNTEKRLCTQHLGIGGTVGPIYVSEHLSPTLKSLHAATRIKAREMCYKFVWVRNGRIFVRKAVEHQAIVIKNIDSLKLLV